MKEIVKINIEVVTGTNEKAILVDGLDEIWPGHISPNTTPTCSCRERFAAW